MAILRKVASKKARSARDDEASVMKRLKQKRDYAPDTCIFC